MMKSARNSEEPNPVVGERCLKQFPVVVVVDDLDKVPFLIFQNIM